MPRSVTLLNNEAVTPIRVNRLCTMLPHGGSYARRLIPPPSLCSRWAPVPIRQSSASSMPCSGPRPYDDSGDQSLTARPNQYNSGEQFCTDRKRSLC